MLGLVRSMKNNFAPISRIPPDVFFLIPEHLQDGNLITMTHVCRGWRELLIARPSLWTYLDCMNADKASVYVKRSKSSPLRVIVYKDRDTAYLEDAFLSIVPHISRLKSLTFGGRTNILKTLTPHISCHIPLLRELKIILSCKPTPVLEGTLFNGDLSSLRTLCLAGIITHLPWKNLSELTTLTLSRIPTDEIFITRLLDFFVNAHRLKDITLIRSIPASSNTPPGRVVSIPCLETLAIEADVAHSILLNHLSIPVGTSLLQKFAFHGDKSPLPDFLPQTLGNLKNVSSITSVSLYFEKNEKRVRLDGPSGGLRMLGRPIEQDEPIHRSTLDSQIIQSLAPFVHSGIQTLAITEYKPLIRNKVDESTPYRLLHMENLRILTLTR